MVRRALGIPTVKWNYDQSAVVAVLHLSEVSVTFSMHTVSLWILCYNVYGCNNILKNHEITIHCQPVILHG